jgi:hypothetical protein
MSDTSEVSFSSWVILELLGHRRLAGKLTEQQIAGHGFLRLDVPSGCDSGVSARYCTLHGACTCPVAKDDGPVNVALDCPLHLIFSQHPQPWSATQFYSPSSVYCMIAASNRPEPATRWELERAERVPGRDVEIEDDDDDDENDFAR